MKRTDSLQKLNIPPDHKLILCCDGGGIRGILTLQLLKKLEEITDTPCYELFDMVAGTSTGGIIAGLIANRRSAAEIEELYIKLVTKVFVKRSWMANRFIDPPLYDKVNYRKALHTLTENLTLRQTCAHSGIDLLITSKDVSAGEETFFTCFSNGNGDFYGTYKDVLLRAVMEATMSAPTYFNSLDRFVDGGTTTYNNPSLGALMEALHYGPKDKYKADKLTVFSFGTGISVQLVKPAEVIHPKGMDIAFWLKYIMTETGQDASDMQVDVIRNVFKPLGTDYRRFQLSLDVNSMAKLPDYSITALNDVEADTLHDLSNDDLNGIALDDVSKFSLMKTIGQAMAEYIMVHGGAFTRDLIDARGKDELISSFGDIKAIKKQMSDVRWLDGFTS